MTEEKNPVTHLTDENFDTEINNSPLPVLVDFWAPWCAPCLMVAPILEKIAVRFDGKVKVAKVNVDENFGVAGRFGITSIPTLIFFKAGKEIDRTIGALPERILVEKLNGLLQ